MSQSFIPFGSKVLLKQVSSVEKTETGLYIPESAKEKSNIATVIAIGEGKLLDNGTRAAMTMRIGDTVIFDQYIGTKIITDKQEYLVMDESNILGKLVTA